MPHPRFRPAATAFAAALVLAAWGTSSVNAQPVPAVQAAAVYPIALPAQPLGAALNELARQARLQLMVHPDLVAGKQAPAVSGQFTASQALERVLAGSGLGASLDGNAAVIRALPAATSGATLPPVVVNAAAPDATPALQQDGTAADGYRAKTVSSVGALGGMALQDTPFSIIVVPRELVQNIQAQSLDDIYKLNPSTRTATPQITGWSPLVNIRGFNGYNTAEDGLRRLYNHAAVVEDKERIEILNGLSGFLFGAAQPGGMINSVYKRPTVERLNSLTVGNYGGSQAYVHGDFGGRFDEAGRVGYRLNVVKQEGGTAVDDQKINRSLFSAAVDWHVTDRLLLEFNAVYNKYRTSGSSAYWFFSGVPHGRAPDARRNWGQPWVNDEFENTKLMGKATYKVNDKLTLRGAYMRDDIDRPVQDHTLNSVRSPTGFTQNRQRVAGTKDAFAAASAMADISFDTGPVAHKLTLGYYMYSDKSWSSDYYPSTGYKGPYPFFAPTYVPEPVFPPNTYGSYYAGRVSNTNYLIGDNIQFDDRWSLLLGITRSNIRSQSLDSGGARTQPDYDKSRNSPSVSLLYKPVPWLTTYVSYIEGLEQGGIAPDTASNAGAILAPMVSKQKEIGLKATVGELLLTTALFDIEKAYEYTDSRNVYAQNGRQNHKGIEFNVSGRITDRWTVVTGITSLDAEVKGSELDGKTPQNVAKLIAKFYTEYELPVPGLTLTGGIYHTGKQWANAANTDRLPAVTTADLGLRYAMKLSGRPLTLRLNVNNVANKSYWLNSYYVGAPRSVAFSAQMPF
ncbi:TonB-dependent siderophore receptor [Variovorax sp. CY25R-8]|uniref:TonB-dependent siderophore receptor n=1 Tax=Variovorax sp. CY25R-8 TaxID=2855501 RepID=UPI0021BB9225|nr:TonB-dependent siderophore receptor [Variovorax sp. CY25R-8]MCT8179398.1 TonB-dependent siderophore receptor [Variovorax sp. CY25R-8]